MVQEYVKLMNGAESDYSQGYENSNPGLLNDGGRPADGNRVIFVQQNAPIISNKRSFCGSCCDGIAGCLMLVFSSATMIYSLFLIYCGYQFLQHDCVKAENFLSHFNEPMFNDNLKKVSGTLLASGIGYVFLLWPLGLISVCRKSEFVKWHVIGLIVFLAAEGYIWFTVRDNLEFDICGNLVEIMGYKNPLQLAFYLLTGFIALQILGLILAFCKLCTIRNDRPY